MALHRLSSITLAVHNVAEVSAQYDEFGLSSHGDGSFSTTDGGKQLYLDQGPTRRLVQLGIGADDHDDLGRIERSLEAMGVVSKVEGDTLRTADPATGTGVVVTVQDRLVQPVVAPPTYNGPGRDSRQNGRAPGVTREGPVRPRKLGHVVLGSADHERTKAFFIDGTGFKVSDTSGPAAFIRCSTASSTTRCGSRNPSRVRVASSAGDRLPRRPSSIPMTWRNS